MELKGSQMEPKGYQKGSQGATKVHPKIDVGKRSEKWSQNGSKKGAILDQNPLKIHPKIYAKIDTEKVWKIHEK